MANMGRKPTKNLNLPKGMRARRQKSGRIFYYLDTGGKPRREIPLGYDYPAAVRKWSELAIAEPPKIFTTFADLADRYRQEAIPQKAPRTQRDNLAELDKLAEFFGNPPAPLDQIKPVHVRQYMDWRGATAKTRANREKALLSAMWNFARERGITDLPNPCRGVRGFHEPGRKDIYIDDDVFNAVRACASQAVRDAMDLAHLTGQRPADVLKTSETDIRDGMLSVRQGKTGKTLRLRLTGPDGQRNGLGRLIDELLARRQGKAVRNLALIHSAGTHALSYSGLDNGFERARVKAAKKAEDAGHPDLAARIRGFQFRDLRAKAGTEKADAEGILEAQRLLGHASVTMTDQYVRLGQIVTPTR